VDIFGDVFFLVFWQSARCGHRVRKMENFLQNGTGFLNWH